MIRFHCIYISLNLYFQKNDKNLSFASFKSNSNIHCLFHHFSYEKQVFFFNFLIKKRDKIEIQELLKASSMRNKLNKSHINYLSMF